MNISFFMYSYGFIKLQGVMMPGSECSDSACSSGSADEVSQKGLFRSMARGDFELVFHDIDRSSGASLNITLPDSHGKTAIHYVVSAPALPAYIRLLKENYQVNIDAQDLEGNTAAHLAALGGSKSKNHMLALSQAGADLTIPNNDGLTPRDLAILKYGSEAAIQWSRACMDAAKNPVGLADVQAYIALGAHVGFKDEYGCTVLHWAAIHNWVGLIEGFVSRKEVDHFNAQDVSGRTAAHHAARFSRVQAMEALAKYPGLRWDIRDLQKLTPLGLADPDNRAMKHILLASVLGGAAERAAGAPQARRRSSAMLSHVNPPAMRLQTPSPSMLTSRPLHS